MQPASVDVCIIGGGFAGLAAAISLRQSGASVVVLDRRVELGDPHRGDWLPPSVVDQLKEWGVELRQAVPASELMVEWVSHRATRRKLAGDSFFVPANQLEAALRERARALGVDLRLGWQTQMLLQEGKGRIGGVTATNGADFAAFQTRLLVVADGRASTLREKLGLSFKRAESAYSVLALEAELSPGVQQSSGTLTFSVGPEGGGLAAPLPNRRLRVLVLLKPGEAETLSRQSPQQLAAELPRRAPLPLSSVIEPARMRVFESPITGHAQNYATEGAVCIGEAAHPTTIPLLDGISMAVLDAEALARAVNPTLAGDRKAIDKALVKFETERWPDNERRLLRARKVLRWLQPRGAIWGILLRTPLARFFVGALLSFD